MRWLLLLVSTMFLQPQARAAIDVSAITIGTPTTIAELDLGKLKGDITRVAWSPDGTQVYIRTNEGEGLDARLHFYTVPAAGGAVAPVGREPDWAAEYWTFKSDRSAPGVDGLVIDVKTGKAGTKSIVPADGVYSDGGSVNLGLSNANSRTMQSGVLTLVLLDEPIGEFTDTKPVPGLTFGWGPDKSGAIAFVDTAGHLFLMDRQKHKQTVAGVKDALLPAWTTDGAKLAYVQKTGRRKYALVWVPIGRS
jgi:dipeptidyl aminopeptidase/acylaminoacyl peptidase